MAPPARAVGSGRIVLGRLLAGLGFCTRRTAGEFARQPFVNILVSSSSNKQAKTQKTQEFVPLEQAALALAGFRAESDPAEAEVSRGAAAATVRKALSSMRLRRSEVRVEFVPQLARARHRGAGVALASPAAGDGVDSVDSVGLSEEEGDLDYDGFESEMESRMEELMLLEGEALDRAAEELGLEAVRHPWQEVENSAAVRGLQFLGEKDLMAVVLNKPPGYVSSHNERDGRSVFELLPERFRFCNPGFSIAGRLDKEASGLCIITQDGQLTSRVIGGSSQHDRVSKVYEVRLRHPLRGHEGDVLRSGELLLRNEAKPCRPVEFEVLSDGPHDPRELELSSPLAARRRPAGNAADAETAEDAFVGAGDEDADEYVDPRAPVFGEKGGPLVRVGLTEGKYHQVKRMFAALSNRVEHLHRSDVGPLPLGNLEAGEWRSMTHPEYRALMKRNPRLTRSKAQGKGQRARVDKSAPALSGQVF